MASDEQEYQKSVRVFCVCCAVAIGVIAVCMTIYYTFGPEKAKFPSAPASANEGRDTSGQ